MSTATPPSLDEPALDWPTRTVLTVGSAATGLLVVVEVLAITGVIRPVWSHPDAGPDQPVPTAPDRPPPPMAVDLRLPIPFVGEQP